jgi:hypothetical protein
MSMVALVIRNKRLKAELAEVRSVNFCGEERKGGRKRAELTHFFLSFYALLIISLVVYQWYRL